jgi:hypothetical protein
MESKKEQWIEKALNSLDGIQPAIPAANLQGRIMQRIQAERFRIVPDTVHLATIYRAAAAILLIVAMNVFTCVLFQKNESEKKGLQSFAKEYSISATGDSFLNI